ncbi:hypothetical protein C8F01DRAFT_1147927 [Mycena amicta]|nr:hypothetical protein C8F01DRAFT_1147927 [Mycena amicta]
MTESFPSHPHATTATSLFSRLGLDSDAGFAVYQSTVVDQLRDFACTWIDGFRHLRLQQVELAAFVRYIPPSEPPLPLPNDHPSSSSDIHDLPPDFPFGDFRLSSTFQWIQEYTLDAIDSEAGARRESINHCYSVEFFFRGRTGGMDSPVAWEVRTPSFGEPSSQVAIGSITHRDKADPALATFEISSPIYEDTSSDLPFSIDADLVLEAISASLAARTPVHLVSRVLLVPAIAMEDAAAATAAVSFPGSATVTVSRMLRLYELRIPPAPGNTSGGGGSVVRLLGTKWLADS